MARTNGLTGGITGKVGSMVFYYRDGKYIARQYIPNPSNPKSVRQVIQRLKFSLAGKLSSIVPYAAIEGMGGGSKTGRRSAFMKNVLLNSTVTDGVASILFKNVVFSEGSLALATEHVVSVGTPSTYNRFINILTRHLSTSDALAEGYGERYVVLLLNTSTSQFDYAVTGLLEMPVSTVGETTEVTTTVSIAVGDRTAVYKAIVYVYPFIAGSGRKSGLRTSYLGTESGTIVVNEDTGEELGSPEVFGRSDEIRDVDVNPPQAQSSSRKRLAE